MKTNICATLVAGLLLQAANATAFSLVIKTHMKNNEADLTNVRMGHAVPPTIALIPGTIPLPAEMSWRGPPRRKGCMGRFADAFRKAVGRPAMNEVHILPIGEPNKLIFENPPAEPNHGWRMRHHHHHGRHGATRFHTLRANDNFMDRLHLSLSALGPWEGRAVAFVLGCGIGVLLRMLWVLTIVSYRAFRGRRDENEDGEYHHILFEQIDAEDIVVAPPVYVVDEKVPIPEEQNTKSVQETN